MKKRNLLLIMAALVITTVVMTVFANTSFGLPGSVSIRPVQDKASSWVPFVKDAKPGSASVSTMKEETTMGMMLNFDIPGMYTHKVSANGITFDRLSIPGHTTLQDLGKPELPVLGQIVEIPHGVNLQLEIFKSKSVTLKNYNVYPAQRPEPRALQVVPNLPVKQNLTLATANKFTLDKATYGRKNLYPGQLATVKAQDIGIVRGHRLVFIKVNPVQYNPVTKEITAYSNIEVRLKYNRPAQVQRVDTRKRSKAYEQMLKASVLNYKPIERFGNEEPGKDQESGCDYLIITHGDFYNPQDPNNPIMRFRDWKQRKGLKTKIVDAANLSGGNTADSIKTYIQNAYNQWPTVPTYVLLVGDTGFIPTNYQTDHPNHNNKKAGTDHYYTTVDGTDYYPDIFIGRIPVDTLQQCETVIDKILAYERSAPAAADYYTDTSLVQLFEDAAVDGREDGTFRIIEFAEEIRTFLGNNGYDVNRIYDQSGNHANGPERYENGTAMPNALTIAGGFPWDGDTTDITDAINNGNFLVTYDGHGGRTEWSRPNFDNTDAGALTNGSLTPVIFSLACMTGWFDNETDDATLNTNNNDESLCETLLRHDNGGTVGVIGSTRISWDNNDFMMLGMYKAIWPNFDPNPPFGPGQLPDMDNSELYKMGQINTFSKIYMANYYADNIYRKLSFELYHVFGDPEMPVFTEQPALLKVNHPKGIGSTGEQDFIVNVTDNNTASPVENATVVLTRGSSIVSVKQTDPAGNARFTLNGPGSGDLNLTVTAHNHRPYEGSIMVSGIGALLNRLEPQNGVNNQSIIIGGKNFSGNEPVEIYFGDQLVLTKTASAGYFGQSGVEDVTFDVPGTANLGPVNIVARGTSSDRYAVDVFQVRKENPLDLYTYSQWDDSTWHLNPGDNPTWNNPEIQIYDNANNPVASNNLVVGQNYTVKVKVHNDTDFAARGAKVTLKWADFGIGQPDRVWNVVGSNVIDVPAHGIKEAIIRWSPSNTGHLCIKADVYHIEDIQPGNNSGQENCHVGTASSPHRVQLTLWNNTTKPAMVYLELRQLNKPGIQQRVWGSWIKQPDPQLIPAGQKREVVVTVDPDLAEAKPGEKAEFALTGYINGKMSGGINLTVTKNRRR